jgi:hypothetical protein
MALKMFLAFRSAARALGGEMPTPGDPLGKEWCGRERLRGGFAKERTSQSRECMLALGEFNDKR